MKRLKSNLKEVIKWSLLLIFMLCIGGYIYLHKGIREVGTTVVFVLILLQMVRLNIMTNRIKFTENQRFLNREIYEKLSGLVVISIFNVFIILFAIFTDVGGSMVYIVRNIIAYVCIIGTLYNIYLGIKVSVHNVIIDYKRW